MYIIYLAFSFDLILMLDFYTAFALGLLQFHFYSIIIFIIILIIIIKFIIAIIIITIIITSIRLL